MVSKQCVRLGLAISFSLSACVIEDAAPLSRPELAAIVIDETMGAWEDRYGSMPEQCLFERSRIQLVEFDQLGMEEWCKHEGAIGCFRANDRHWPAIGWSRVGGQTDAGFSDVLTHESVHWLISCSGMDHVGDASHSMDPWVLSPI
jgi:hypothetical protein